MDTVAADEDEQETDAGAVVVANAAVTVVNTTIPLHQANDGNIAVSRAIIRKIITSTQQKRFNYIVPISICTATTTTHDSKYQDKNI